MSASSRSHNARRSTVASDDGKDDGAGVLTMLDDEEEVSPAVSAEDLPSRSASRR